MESDWAGRKLVSSCVTAQSQHLCICICVCLCICICVSYIFSSLAESHFLLLIVNFLSRNQIGLPASWFLVLSRHSLNICVFVSVFFCVFVSVFHLHFYHWLAISTSVYVYSCMYLYMFFLYICISG